MTNLYVRSADGSDADNGSTWALAKATVAGAAAIDAVGDSIFLAAGHSESTAASVTLALAGSHASPTTLACVDDTADPAPPVALAATAVIATGAGAYSLTTTGTAHISGVIFKSGVGGSTSPANIVQASTDGNYQKYANCEFWVASTSGSCNIQSGSLSGGSEARVDWSNCNVKFASATHTITPRHCKFRWNGGGILAAGTSPNILVTIQSDQADILLENLDLSNATAVIKIFDAPGGANVGLAVIRNSKLPSGWTGSVGSTPNGMLTRLELYNCSAGNINYALEIKDYAGTITHEDVIVRTGGASDGTTSLARKMVTSANAEYPLMVLASPEIATWNDTVGSAVTATVEVVHDSQGAGTGAALQDDEAWLELSYLGTSGFPLGTFASDKKVLLATAADQASSSETWTTTGLTAPVKQKLSVTFTPQVKGFVLAKVMFAKASKTIYYCHKMTVA